LKGKCLISSACPFLAGASDQARVASRELVIRH
jgi:hypothetical protein